MPKVTSKSEKGLDVNFFAAFDELSKMYGDDVAFKPLQDAVAIIRTRREKGEEPTEEERERVRYLIGIAFRNSLPLRAGT